MFTLMKTIFIVERKNIKFKSILSLIILFIIGSFIYLENSQFRELEPATAAEVVAKNAALDLYKKTDATDPEVASAIYRNLNLQSTKLALRSLGLITKDDSIYIQGAIELTQVRNEIYTMNGFNEVAQYMPTYRQNRLDQVFYMAIQDQNKELLVDNSNFPTYIILFLFVLGYSWYLLVGIFSSDILLEEENHQSLVKGYPFTMATKLLAKICSYLIFIIGLLFFTFFITILIASIMYDIDLTYPVAIFNGDYFTIAIWEYIGISFIYFICLSLTALTISIVLNYYVKNLYIITFVHFILFFIMQLLPATGKWLWFMPFNYFNFSTLINGQTAESAGNQMIRLSNGFIILVTTFIVMLLFIYWQFYLSQIRHSNKLNRGGGKA
ncbi:hypothetical protein [Ornithinibacillus halotolerans]|uniref:ABC transporter permease n=1 Tax=Ornithinibacillus halotolerans TaxID=1274357 RepID=A0A916W9R5_9BACI|nr:hypothetical protein [Ornithinibacillus halotolerans]GGA78696.1 hypothetical protein GCM10008025_22750 [Ornithinibacillus halotolerans]